MSYGEILKTAFSITRRHRYLWFFGLFGGAGTGFNVPGGNFGGGDGTGLPRADNPFAGELPPIDAGVIVAIVAIVLVLALVAFALFLVSQGALADSVAAIDRGGARRFGTAWQAGRRTFWRVLGWVALLFVIALGLLLVIGGPLAGLVIGVFSATDALGARIAVGIVAGLIALAAIVLVFIPLGIVGELSIRELVLGGARPVDALRRGYRLFRANLGPSVIVWLILLGITIGAGIALLIVLVIVGIVLFLPTIGLAIAELAGAAIVTGVAAGVVLVGLLLVALGAFGTFRHAVWTLAYLRLQRPVPPPPSP